MLKPTFAIKKLNTTALSLLFFAALSSHAAFGMDEDKGDLPLNSTPNNFNLLIQEDHKAERLFNAMCNNSKPLNQVNLLTQSGETQDDPIKAYITKLTLKKKKELQNPFQSSKNGYIFKKNCVNLIKQLNEYSKKTDFKDLNQRVGLMGIMAMKIGTIVLKDLNGTEEVFFRISLFKEFYNIAISELGCNYTQDQCHTEAKRLISTKLVYKKSDDNSSLTFKRYLTLTKGPNGKYGRLDLTEKGSDWVQEHLLKFLTQEYPHGVMENIITHNTNNFSNYIQNKAPIIDLTEEGQSNEIFLINEIRDNKRKYEEEVEKNNSPIFRAESLPLLPSSHLQNSLNATPNNSKPLNQVNLLTQSGETQDDPIKKYVSNLKPEVQNELQNLFQSFSKKYKFNSQCMRDVTDFIQKLNNSCKDLKLTGHNLVGFTGLMVAKIGETVIKSNTKISFLTTLFIPIYKKVLPEIKQHAAYYAELLVSSTLRNNKEYVNVETVPTISFSLTQTGSNWVQEHLLMFLRKEYPHGVMENITTHNNNNNFLEPISPLNKKNKIDLTQEKYTIPPKGQNEIRLDLTQEEHAPLMNNENGIRDDDDFSTLSSSDEEN